jgi:hypothetical protein
LLAPHVACQLSTPEILFEQAIDKSLLEIIVIA